MSDKNKLMQNMQQEMRRGSLVLAVLLLMDQPEYGYSLVQALNTQGILVEQNTLYPLLRRLEKQGLLESLWQVEENRPRRYYKISTSGIELRSALVEEWRSLNASLEQLVKGDQND